jgi:hypothetical protein
LAESQIPEGLDEYQTSGYGEGSHAHVWYIDYHCVSPILIPYCRSTDQQNGGEAESSEADEGEGESNEDEDEDGGEDEVEYDEGPRPYNKYIDDCAKESMWVLNVNYCE